MTFCYPTEKWLCCWEGGILGFLQAFLSNAGWMFEILLVVEQDHVLIMGAGFVLNICGGIEKFCSTTYHQVCFKQYKIVSCKSVSIGLNAIKKFNLLLQQQKSRLLPALHCSVWEYFKDCFYYYKEKLHFSVFHSLTGTGSFQAFQESLEPFDQRCGALSWFRMVLVKSFLQIQTVEAPFSLLSQ